VIDVREENGSIVPAGFYGKKTAEELVDAIVRIEDLLANNPAQMHLRSIVLPTIRADLLWLHAPAGGHDLLFPTHDIHQYQALEPIDLGQLETVLSTVLQVAL
jgi:hypothetical protein